MTFFAAIERVPGDPILGVTEAYNADPRPGKVNLGVGIYYDESGRIPVLSSVTKMEQSLLGEARPRGYLPIDGLPAYIKGTQRLLFGEASPLLAEGRVATAQTLGGSGALRIGAELLRQHLPMARVAISNPSWENHRALFGSAGFEILGYRYYDPATHSVDFAGMLEDVGQLDPGTVLLLHACCHNPTGVDLNEAQWKQLIALIEERRLLPFVDIAYQGFDQGVEQDAKAIHLLAASRVENFIVASSYSKSFSLYGERVGALSVVGTDRDEAERVKSQLKRVIRANYSTPATHGGSLVAGVLASEELRAGWLAELTAMRERIHAMREGLVARLKVQGAGDYGFIQQQAGMFSYSGLSSQQMRRLREEHAIYALDSGRICIAALNQANLDRVATAMAAVSRD